MHVHVHRCTATDRTTGRACIINAPSVSADLILRGNLCNATAVTVATAYFDVSTCALFAALELRMHTQSTDASFSLRNRDTLAEEKWFRIWRAMRNRHRHSMGRRCRGTMHLQSASKRMFVREKNRHLKCCLPMNQQLNSAELRWQPWGKHTALEEGHRCSHWICTGTCNKQYNFHHCCR